MHGLYWLAVELSARVPLLVCVDDAQWADAPSLRWLAYLSRRLEGVALLLLVGRRDGEPNALLDQVMSEARAEVLRPCPLSEDAVEQWVANAYGQAPAREFAHECWRLSGGNPLLLGELVAQLQAEGLRPDAASGRRIEGVAPDAISRSVLARLARQGADAVAVAEAVAVLSQDARVDRVATLAGVPVARVAELADRLADAGILRTEEPLAFAHPVLRTAVYEQIGVVRRGLAHATAARMLLEGGGGVEHAAAHLQLAPVVGQSWAVEALRAAARAARSRGAPDAAVPLLRRVLAENPRDRTEVLLELARAEATARDPAALDHAREVVMSGTTATQRVHGAFVGAEALLDQGHGREAVELLESANGDGAAVEANLKLELAARTLLTESFTGFSGLDAPLTALGVDDLVGGTAGERLLLALRAIDLSLRACPRRTSLRIARRVLAREDLAAPAHAFLPVMARALTLADELDEARATLTQVIDGARRRGSVIDLATGCAARSDVEYRAGRLDGAEADARQALVIAIEHNLWLLPAALAWTVEVLLEREPPATVLDVIADATIDLSAPPPTQASGLLLYARGRAHVGAGDLAAAAEDFRASGRIATHWGDVNPASNPWRSSLALALVDDADEAQRLVAEELELARRFGAARAIGIALRARSLLARGDEMVDGLREAVEVLAGSPARLEYARAVVDLGAASRRVGRRMQARETLAEGLDAARACGAHRLAERAREELRAAGARPRRERLHGPDALTASERRVSQLAADGLTNRQIAQALFVTTKTVEMHLGHAYGKLGIKRRDQLATELISSSSKANS